MEYKDFLIGKTSISSGGGFEPFPFDVPLFDFQEFLVSYAIFRGRCGVFADCGLGKTAMQLEWSSQVVRYTNKPVLILTPLAVSAQTLQEAARFGVDARRASVGTECCSPRVYITNYEKLRHFDPDIFGGVVCDESSILKSFSGSRRKEITVFMRKIPYRLLATATAAPNDYVELGTSSEALGYLGHVDMLNKFFKNDLNNSASGRAYGEVIKWRFKGHAETAFWRWVCSWARALRNPSDYGFSDEGFNLPPLIENEIVVESRTKADGMLFDLPAVGLDEQREERKRTIQERCEKVAETTSGKDCSLVWCHLNAEGDLLSKIIPGAVQIKGSDSEEKKEERLLAFANGEIKTLVTKPKIGAWGLNFQNCAHVTYFPSHSFEQYYQSVRRCWRFGQKSPVTVDIVRTEGDAGVVENMKAKARKSEQMFQSLVLEMRNAEGIKLTTYEREMEVPSWL